MKKLISMIVLLLLSSCSQNIPQKIDGECCKINYYYAYKYEFIEEIRYDYVYFDEDGTARFISGSKYGALQGYNLMQYGKWYLDGKDNLYHHSDDCYMVNYKTYRHDNQFDFILTNKKA